VPVKPGNSITSRGSLLLLDETLPDGTRVTFSSSSAQITRSVLRLLFVELVAALAALAVSVVLVLRGTRSALRPLAEVNETATRIAAGDRALRLRPERTDTELGSMAAAFDQMVDALDAALEHAESAETAMRRFLADASHELRTPVASLQASAETLLREQPDRPQKDELEAALARQAARLGRLIDDLLSLARLEDADGLPDESVDLDELARAAVAEARQRAPELRIDLDAHDARTRGDAGGLQRALRNLLDNAVTAAAPDGHVDVAVRAGADDAEITVSDDGPGIPETDRERIFERFVRLDQARPGGSGLGLAIAQRIARRHGGDLTCDRVPSGSSFTLRLPADGSGR
jgi:two-component system, OmpR family, sensor kinase